MKENIKNYLLENKEELRNIVSELNAWNGCLDWLDYWENGEEFFEVMFNNKQDVARAVFYGSYNYMDDLVHFDAYGNLESIDEQELEQEMVDYIDEIVDALVDNAENLDYLSDELRKMLSDEN